MTPRTTEIACTVIAKNYVSLARTVCNSFLEHHPGAAFYVLVIDDIEGYLAPDAERFSIVTIDQLGILDLREFCFKYAITELSTAVKPYFLKHLLDRTGAQKVLYLDPDVLVTNPLDGLFQQLDAHDILLTPHIEQDFPADGKTPTDSQILKSGVFNLGFIGLRKSGTVDRFLLWWQEKLYDKCVIDPAAGYFVDQKFIDLAITLFRNIAVVDDPGYNVAYWNLHCRTVRAAGASWTCNGGPLYFFHFSNYKPDHPDRISGHQTRHDLALLPDLRQLFHQYRDLLMANGYRASVGWPYTYNQYRNAREFALTLRRLYRLFRTNVTLSSIFNVRNYPNYFRIVTGSPSPLRLVTTAYHAATGWLFRSNRSTKGPTDRP